MKKKQGKAQWWQRLLSLFFCCALGLNGLIAPAPLLAAENTPQEATAVQGEYIIQYKVQNGRSVTSPEAAKVLKTYDAEVASMGKNGLALVEADLNMTEAEEQHFIEDLKASPGVATVEKNHEVSIFKTQIEATVAATATSDDPFANLQWGPEKIRAAAAWQRLPGSTATVRVAVIDTGVEANHPDLVGKILAGKNMLTENSVGAQYGPDDTNDDHGHGTHVSGIIAATCNNGLGIQGVTGTTDIKILPVKVLNDDGKGSTYNVINGIYYAADQGVSIINLSLGSGYYSEAEATAVRYAQSKGCLVIAAAGNDGWSVEGTYPASYDNVISVGSVDAKNDRSYFSNYGPSLDIAAPGSSILSSIPRAIAMVEKSSGKTVYGDDINGYYTAWSGTSMACPHVVGVAALYKAANPNADSFDIGNHLLNTATDVGEIGKDVYTGAGIVNADAALGGDIRRTPLVLQSPSPNQELYETVNLQAQVNTSMGISKLCFYLDEVKDSNKIADITCNSSQSFYEYSWDTNTKPDGNYKLIGVVYDDQGQQLVVEDSQGNQIKDVTIDVQILNSITNGFTMIVKDPKNDGANTVDYQIYGQNDQGGYNFLRSGYTTDLGFARVKGISGYSNYLIMAKGNMTDGDNTNYFIYRRTVGQDKLGQKITLDATKSQEYSFSMPGNDDTELSRPYLQLTPTYEKSGVTTNMKSLGTWVMQPGAKLYLDQGDYLAEGYSGNQGFSTDSFVPAYYLSNNFSVGNAKGEIKLDYKTAKIVTPQFDQGATGKMQLSQIKGKSSIPFGDGTISGSAIYLTNGGEFSATADLSATKENKTWQVRLEKPQPITVASSNVQIPFGAKLEITDFKGKNGLLQDNGNSYLFCGNTFTTENNIGDKNGNRILYITQGYPIFRIYKLNDSQEKTLVYEDSSRGQMTSSYWNSAKNYLGNLPPAAGNYLAELTFDAGPFGGESTKQLPFALRTKSGGEEQSIKLTMADYILPNAQIDFFYWSDEDGGKWQPARDNSNKLLSKDDGIISQIPIDQIKTNSSGINIALITTTHRQKGYSPKEAYKSYALVPYSNLKDLVEVKLQEGTPVTVKISDNGNNAKSAPLFLPISSNCGGKLAKAAQVTDLRMEISSEYNGGKLYLPAKTKYDYVYSTFNDSTSNYFLTAQNFAVQTGSTLQLSGAATKNLEINLPSGITGDQLWLTPELGTANNSGGLNFAINNKFTISPGRYTAKCTIQANATTQYTVASNQVLDLTKDTTWKIDGNFTPTISLNQSQVPETQMLLGNIAFKDAKSNKLVGVGKKDGLIYKAVYPTVMVGTTDANQQALEVNPQTAFQQITIPASAYKGTGKHFAYLTYDWNGSTQTTDKQYFTVGDSIATDHLLTAPSTNWYTASYGNNEELLLTIKNGGGGFKQISVNVANTLGNTKVTFALQRKGVTLKSIGVDRTFQSGNSKVSAAFNLQPGDVVMVTAK